MSEQIAIADIVVLEDRRPLDQAKVAEIAELIKAVGLLSPIGVRRIRLKDGSLVGMLVYGMHRLEACRSLGWEKIGAIAVADVRPEGVYLDDFVVKMMEIAENLHRADLTTQERNEQLARWVALLEKRKPPDIGAAAPISEKPGRKPSAAVAEVAKRSGLGTKTVKEAIKTTGLAPEVKAAADDAKLSHKQRLAIARLPEAEQRGAVSKQAAIKMAADRAEAAAKKKRKAAPMSEPAPMPEPNKAQQGSVGPSARFLIMDVRQLISDQLPNIAQNEWPRLVKELHSEIDDIVQSIEKRMQAAHRGRDPGG